MILTFISNRSLTSFEYVKNLAMHELHFTYFLMPITGYRLEHTRITPCCMCEGYNPLFDIAYYYYQRVNNIDGGHKDLKHQYLTGFYCCSESCFNMWLINKMDRNMMLFPDGHMEYDDG